MESTSLKLAKMFEEDSDKGSNVLCSFFSSALVENTPGSMPVMPISNKDTYHSLPMVSIREANTNWLVDKK
jgi:hypothetical protein